MRIHRRVASSSRITTVSSEQAARRIPLACTDLTMDSPYYIFAKRQPTGGEPHQSLYLPHDSVLMIFRYAEDEPNPLGFVPK